MAEMPLLRRSLCLAACAILVAGCGGREATDAPLRRVSRAGGEPFRGRVEDLKPVAGQVVYVPVYSHVYHSDGRHQLNLTALLSVRNTDRTARIVVTRVDYYGTDGKLLRRELPQPVALGPLAVSEIVVPEADTAGGSGASFLVEWVAEQPASEPVVESVMIGTIGSQGISFVCPGRVVEERTMATP